ncbi:hypothetical protein TOPH_07099 [Tolypocladium ophioglossoides CBS 100239]|uniref:Uncharacterized protein n=1 Tax=Tolypocladium ophioglossoides (strain CBS 100239) TaxID=1163406 RepID=A0A0L0N2H7_TOLOC|nr:hypothetical protein TOPH_07099 [Tolypocladium ophioglossoides CBS 100239]
MDLGLNSPSLESEIGHPLEEPYLQSSGDLGAMQSGHCGQTFAQEPPPRRSVEQSEQEQQSELHGASQGSYMISPFISTLLPCYSEAPSNHPRRRLSLARNITPENLHRHSQDEATAHIMGFDQQEETALTTGSEDTGTDSGYGQAVSSQPSTSSNIQGSYNTWQKTTKQAVEPVMTSWIRKLSDINVELHQHMLSIPPIGVGQSTWTSNGPNSTRHDEELAVDRTFKLSHQFMEILNDIFSRFKTRQAYTGPTTDTLALDQPSQLLVLSSYLCLVESYDKILRHIKTWTEVRFKMGVSTSDEHFPIQLPGLAIGSFKLPTSSSTQPLVLTCTIESMIMHMHNLVSEMMTPTNTGNGTTRVSNTAAGDQGTSGGDGLSSVAKVTLQAIRAKEDSTTELIHVVWKLALRCGPP